MMKLIDMKMSKADLKEDQAALTTPSNPYPYGLCLNLDTDELQKLGIAQLPKVGSEYHIVAVGKVTSVSANVSESSGENANMSLQITMLSLDTEVPHAGEAKETTKSETREKGATSVMTNAYRGR